MRQKKLTISVDAAIYDGLYEKIGRRNISRFLSNLARPYVLQDELDRQYQEAAADCEREQEALEWCEAFAGDLEL